MEKLLKRIHGNGIDYILVGDYYLSALWLTEESCHLDECSIVCTYRENRELDLKRWKQEITDLISEKNRMYDKVYEIKAEVQEAEKIQKCVEQAIHTEPMKVQTKRKNIEL